MKLNWVNILATILIVGGIFLLVKRQQVQKPLATPTTRPLTDAEIQKRVYFDVESKLGRPLDDVEKQMISTVRNGNAVQVTIVDPLRGRLMLAQKQHAATQAATGLAPPFPPDVGSPSMSPTTVPAGP